MGAERQRLREDLTTFSIDVGVNQDNTLQIGAAQEQLCEGLGSLATDVYSNEKLLHNSKAIRNGSR